MIRIADLLERDFSRPIEEAVKIDNNDPDTVFAELTEYIATDALKAEYESLFSALAAGAKSPEEGVGVWVSGAPGSGKSSFGKILGYVLANREVLGAGASSLFLKQVESERVREYVEFLNRAVPCQSFMFDVKRELTALANAKQIAAAMYRVALRDLDYAEDFDISALEIDLEKAGTLAAFQDLCRGEYQEDWREVRKGGQNLERSSALLHRLDPRTYASTDTWLDMLKGRPPRNFSVKDLVEKLFDLCEVGCHGKTFAFILDEAGEYVGLGADRLENLCSVVEQFGEQGLARLKAGKIPGPGWFIVTAREKLEDIHHFLVAGGIVPPNLQDRFPLRIDLSSVDIREVAVRRMLRKKQSQEAILRELFRDRGASLIQNVKLERCSRRTEFDEDQFVEFYPYLPHLIDLSIDILAGIRLHPKAPKDLGGSIITQASEMLVSDRTRLADQPVGALVSIDKVYELVERNIPPKKHKDILDLHRRFEEGTDFPGMAARVAKAICLMEFAKTDLPRTTKNIAALLVQRITEAPPMLAVAAILDHMKEAHFVRWTEEGWKLYDFDELRHRTAALEQLGNAVGAVNPRSPGWHNDLIQLGKKLLARMLTWYTRPMHEFNASVSRSLEDIVWTLDHLSTNMAGLDRLSANMDALDRLATDLVALEGRLAQSENRSAARENSRPCIDTNPRNDRTAYIIGLFGTGRWYINDLLRYNIGERAKSFRDTLRIHPGPTSMIYSGHATVKHASRLQYPPVITSRILESVKLGFADLIFIYRHPLDSLLTNWVWWRTYIRENRIITGISQVYETTDDLCADLEENFFDFKTFAEGDPDFFSGAPGPPFLSFSEFVEETELHLQSATLALRLEDFMIDPFKEFSKIIRVMSVDVDLTPSRVDPPRTKPYGYLAVQEKVPRFKNFINELDAETKRRIEKIGYHLI